MSVVKVSEENFKDEVVHSHVPVIVDFWAEWCAPCKMLGPVIEELSNEMENVKFVKVNVDSSQNLARTFGVMSIPTVIIFNKGKEVDRMVGFKPKDSMRKTIETALRNIK